LNERTIILLIVLIIVGGSSAAYFLYFKDIGVISTPQPERVVKRMKIDIPPSEEKKEAAPSSPAQTQVPPTAQMPAQGQPSVPQTGPAKPTEIAKLEVAKKEEAKPPVKEVIPEKKKAVAKKETPKPTAKKAQDKPWAIHVASFTSMDEAQAIAQKLKQGKFNTYITEFNLKGRQWYRVRVGFYSSEEEAKVVGKRISRSYNLSGIWTVKPMKQEVMTHLDG